MASKAIKALKRAEKEGHLIVCEINEDYTSKVCHLCLEQSNEKREVHDNFSGGDISLWGVLQCEVCQHNLSRDYNATCNTLHLGVLKHAGVNRPEVFSHRMTNDPPPESASSDSDDGPLDHDDPMDIDFEPTSSQQLTGFLNQFNL
jgi:transposase